MSCGQIALERAGIPVKAYYASEIDKYAIKITQKNYPNTIQLGDIRLWKSWGIPTPDLILAGSPCQGFSVAGQKLNFDDPRSKLFFTFEDLLTEYQWKGLHEDIDVKFLLENVKMRKDWKQIITDEMGVDPVLINSALVSAQNRERLYWANFPITQPEDKGILLKDVVENGEVDRDKSYAIDANYFKGGSEKYMQKNYFGKSKRQVVKYQSARRLAVHDDVHYRKLTPLECERLQTVPEGYTEGVSNTQRYRMLGNGWTVDAIVHILTQPGFKPALM